MLQLALRPHFSASHYSVKVFPQYRLVAIFVPLVVFQSRLSPRRPSLRGHPYRLD